MGPNPSPISHALAAASTNRFNAWAALNDAALTQYEHTRPAGAQDERELAGVPCGIKDNIDVAGLPTASGSAYPAAAPTQDAEVVRVLRRAGAAIIGKNAMHEIAYGSTGMVSAYEPATNPRAVGRMPGGSSSGSAAAVSAGDVPFAIGTDTGGSVRVPAALCGVVGLRPTTGSLSSAGVSPLSPTLDTLGVLAATVDIARTVWHAISGTDTRSSDADVPLKVGVVVDDYFAHSHHVIHKAVLYATNLLTDYGCTLAPVRLGWLDTALPVYSHIIGVEAARTHRERLAEPLPLFQPETYQRLNAGAHVPGWKYVEALRERDRIRDDLLRIFYHHDVLICPTTPITVPAHDQLTADVGGRHVDVGRALITYTAPWSLTGAPCLAIPLGHEVHGVPSSVQIVGRPGDENSVLTTGSILETQQGMNPSPRVSK